MMRPVGVNILGARKRRTITNAAGLPVVHAVVVSHHEWWLWWFTTSADGLTHRHGVYDTRDRSVEMLSDDDGCLFSSCATYQDYMQAAGPKPCQPVHCPPFQEMKLDVSPEPYVPGSFARAVEQVYGVPIDRLAEALGIADLTE
jgi:hypothetical protein